MTHPVQAYAAVSKDGIATHTISEDCFQPAIGRDWPVIPVTILPTEQYEAMVEALEIIAGRKQCLDNLMGNADVALAALAALKEQD